MTGILIEGFIAVTNRMYSITIISHYDNVGSKPTGTLSSFSGHQMLEFLACMGPLIRSTTDSRVRSCQIKVVIFCRVTDTLIC